MKVLLSAFSCCPGAGSEPGVGWNWVCQVSRRHEVWLLTSDESRAQVERELPANVHATFVPSFRRWARLQTAAIPGLDWLYYYWWQWKAYRAARKLHAAVGFDLAHHVTFVTWRAPSFLSLLPIPFIWGPVGGGGSIPPGLRGELGWKGRVFEGFRHLAARVSRWDPFVRLTMRRATAILAANQETAALFPARCRDKIRVMLGIGMAGTEKAEPVALDRNGESFVVLFVALLRPLKGGTLAMKAFHRLARSRPNALLVIVGDGAERSRLAALARELGVAERVRFLGGLPRPQVLGCMQACDVLLHPSLRDSGGLVLLEAMAQGKPLVCLDLGGPGEIVTAECGLKVQPGNPEQVVTDLGRALETLAGDPALRQRLGEAGRQRVQERFDWDKRGEQMMEIYQRAAR